jgi:hypothetical protein
MPDPAAAGRVHVDLELPLELRPPFGVATAWTRILRARPLRTSPAWARATVIAAIAPAPSLNDHEAKCDQANDEEGADPQYKGGHPERRNRVGTRGAACGAVE